MAIRLEEVSCDGQYLKPDEHSVPLLNICVFFAIQIAAKAEHCCYGVVPSERCLCVGVYCCVHECVCVCKWVCVCVCMCVERVSDRDGGRGREGVLYINTLCVCVCVRVCVCVCVWGCVGVWGVVGWVG